MVPVRSLIAAPLPAAADLAAAPALAALDASPAPFIVLMALGFLIGVAGHIYRSKTAIVLGIGIVFLATLLLPLLDYLGG